MELEEAIKKYRLFILHGVLYKNPRRNDLSRGTVRFEKVMCSLIEQLSGDHLITMYDNKFLECIENGTITEPSRIDKILYNIKE